MEKGLAYYDRAFNRETHIYVFPDLGKRISCCLMHSYSCSFRKSS